MEPWLLWLIGFVLLLIVEMVTPGTFYFVCFAAACLVAAPVEYFLGNTVVSWGAFIVASAGLIVAARPLVRTYLHHETVPSNVDALIGRRGKVIKAIAAHDAGVVKIGAEEWRAVLAEAGPGQGVAEGETVEILAVEGAHVKVRKPLA